MIIDYVHSIQYTAKNFLSGPWFDVCLTVLEDRDFATAPASASHHPGPHQEIGGLALHTFEVLNDAVRMCDNTELRNRAIVAAIWHDYGKTVGYAFDKDGKAYKTDLERKVGHIVWGYQKFCSSSDELPDEDRAEIGHAILAHHGRREWGSPVEPQTRLAYILHTADMLSSRGITE